MILKRKARGKVEDFSQECIEDMSLERPSMCDMVKKMVELIPLQYTTYQFVIRISLKLDTLKIV